MTVPKFFPSGGGTNPQGGGANLLFGQKFAENCMKMKEFGPRGRGPRPWRPLDPPMVLNNDSLEEKWLVMKN